MYRYEGITIYREEQLYFRCAENALLAGFCALGGGVKAFLGGLEVRVCRP